MEAISLSISLAVIVIATIFVLVVPTIIWVHLKLPKLKRVIETICLIPLAIPAIVIVVGIAPLYRFISMHITESPLSLAGVYSMLVLPYTYRSLSSALDTTDVITLYEAAKTLGSGTSRLMAQVIMPTIRSGIMNGAVITIALVLGEFTISLHF
jgi:putative spermidine/putrescine transport system permease protein